MEDFDARAIRAAVERVLEWYVRAKEPRLRAVNLAREDVFAPRVARGAALDDWKDTIARKLGRMERDSARSLEDAARIRVTLLLTRNRLRQVEQILGSTSARKRLGRRLGEAETLRARLRAKDAALVTARRRIVRARAYDAACLEFALIASRDAQTKAYIFGD
ncbi:MAG TPA: hypothetical protein VNL91_03850 [Thermoanaerobaculia bacterium]|nr:hypothetical protein [Thermoanaerobaculia bacterium]